MSQGKPTINFMLVGKTGAGKSATGNTLINRKSVFKASSDTISCTKEPQLECGEFEEYIIKVVDTPGLHDTANFDMSVTLDHICNSMALLPDGFDALLLVMKYGDRVTKEITEVINALRKTFGEVFAKEFCIIVMTYGENFDLDKNEEGSPGTIEEYCQQIAGPPDFLSLLRDCEYRVVLFHNRLSAKREENVNRLLQLVKSRKHRYTSDVFAKFASERNEYVISLKLPQLTAAIQEKLSLLKGELEKAIRDPDPKTEIEAKAQQLLDTIEEESKGTPLMDDLKLEVKQIIKSLETLPSKRQQRKQMLEKINGLVETIKNPPSATKVMLYGLLQKIYTATGILCMGTAFIAPPLVIPGAISLIAAKKLNNDRAKAVKLYLEEERDYERAVKEFKKISGTSEYKK